MSDDTITLVCPNCGSDHLAEVSLYAGTCAGRWYAIGSGDDEPRFDGDGYTDIAWDSGEPVKDGNAQCLACFWTGKASDLKDEGDAELEDEDGGFYCEDCDVNGYDCRTHGEAIAKAVDAARNNPSATLSVLRAGGLA
jgi:hypothetical protein